MYLKLRPLFSVCVFLLVGLVSGCAVPDAATKASGQPFDPYESANRNVHGFNVAVDKFLFRPASKGYTNLIPDPMEDSFNYFSRNLSEPGNVLNHLLQGNFKDAGIGTVRFVLNTTVGFAGLANPASDFGIPEVDTDFGQTLHVWGAPEGAYIELPILGPSTQRDSIGMIADLFISPINFSPVRIVDNIGVYAEILKRMSDRGRYSDTVDSILYESADSYAQARVIFLQNRRFELEGSNDDPYFDPYSDPYDDPYADLYEDPYAE